MSLAQKDFYGILGVSDRAEFAVIRAAYKALIMIYHPDRHLGNQDRAIKKSKEINEAYTVLIDPDKRKKYDAARLGKSGKPDEARQNSFSALNELNIALKESEAILQILNDAGSPFNPYSELHEFQSLLQDSEALLKILNDPD